MESRLFPTRWARHWPLILILLVGLAFRVWALNFGLGDEKIRPDEEVVVNKVIGYWLGDFNPHFFHWPSFFFYLNFLVSLLYYLGGYLTGFFSSISQFQEYIVLNPNPLFIIARALSALSGTLSILVLFFIGKRFSLRAAYLGAFLLSITFLHARDSHFGVTDVSATFLILLSSLFILRVTERDDWKNYLLAGLFAGLGASTKYNAALILLALFPAHIIQAANAPRRGPSGLRIQGWNLWKDMLLKVFFDPKPYLALLVFVLALLATSPYIILDYPKFYEGMQYNFWHLRMGHDLYLGRGWKYHLRFSLRYGIGLLPLVAAGLGMALLYLKKDHKGLVLMSFVILYYIAIGRGRTVFVRYVLLVVPFLCLFAAVFLDFLIEQTEKWSKLLLQPYQKLATIIFTIIISLTFSFESIVSIIQHNILLSKKDTRLEAKEWIEKNVPSGALIAFNCKRGSPQLNPTKTQLREILENHLKNKAYPVFYLPIQIRLQAKNFPNPSYGTARICGKFAPEEVKAYKELLDQVDYVIIDDHPLKKYSPPDPILEQLVGERFQLVKEIIALEKWAHPLYDQIDAYYIPYAHFAGVIRPGPNLKIYKKMSK